MQLLKVIYISQALAPMRRAGRSAAHAASHGLECSWQPRRPRWSAGGRAGSTAVSTGPVHAVLRCMSLLAVPKAAFGCLARAYIHQTAEDGGLQVAPGSPSRCRTRMRPPFCFSQHTHRRGGLRGFHVHRGMTSEGESRHLARPDPIQLDQHAPRRIGTLLHRAGKGWKGREQWRFEAISARGDIMPELISRLAQRRRCTQTR